MGRLLIITVALASLSAAATAAPPPPTSLAPYVRGGDFEPGDYGWMRGRFADSTPADKAAWREIGNWLTACHEQDEADRRAKLAELNVAGARIERNAISDPLCAAVAHLPQPLAANTFAEFQQALAAAKPVADTYLMAVAEAERIGRPRRPDLADALLARPLGEQMLRTATGWGDGVMKDAPALTPDARAIVVARIGIALSKRDHDNTEWLKAIVSEQGWPRISEVGEPASQQAWLLVQHADADPAFQLQALRLMEPLVATGEVGKRNYAYLYDRVMLKITGKQRFATQAMCRAGKRLPQPVEDEKAVDRLRAEFELDPLPSYLAGMNKTFGECRPDPPAMPPAGAVSGDAKAPDA
ncbi:DUF6624 domain-containing protein [Sphingosinicella sp. BN140058]|uniref:DUF6624 domain-containing protein n=1 Tax=Sphingosinicella sp. BN140058 TaxID=1892855 RepID=UPI00198250BA|nr:DUF6624 domain-containing protein [Sphingosinicella sp. BN140058]